MSDSMCLHNCTDVKIAQHQPRNSNAITLRIGQIKSGDQPDGIYARVISATEITLFGLPTEVTDKLIKALGAPK